MNSGKKTFSLQIQSIISFLNQIIDSNSYSSALSHLHPTNAQCSDQSNFSSTSHLIRRFEYLRDEIYFQTSV